MALETFGFISALVTTNPVGASDPKSQGDDHIRGIKSTLVSTFPNASAAYYFPSTAAKTGAYSVVAADQNKILLCDATSAAFTVSLDAVATLGSRFRVTVIKVDSSANAVTIDGNASETINGAVTKALSRQYEAVTLVCNGSAWFSEGFSLDTTAVGRSILTAANAAAAATAAGVGTGDSPTFTAVTLSNGQIVFPASQNASAGANTLDDYEEGTFTPTLTFGGAAVGVTYTTQAAAYTKIGRMVQYRIQITLSSKGSSTGALLFQTLPFNAALSHACSVRFTNLTSGVGDTMLYGFILAATTIRLDKTATGSATQLTDADVANTTDFLINGTFYV